MKCFSEEEQEELDRISENMTKIDFDKAKREQELVAKLEEPDVDEDTTNNVRGSSSTYQQYDDCAFVERSKYKRPTKRVLSTLAAFGAFTSSCLGSEKRASYVCKYEPVHIKGAPGVYNPEKHLSRAQRKKKKNKIKNKKNR